MSAVAVRNPKRGKAHRVTGLAGGPKARYPVLLCGRSGWLMTETVPLTATPPQDRCRNCWPSTGEKR